MKRSLVLVLVLLVATTGYLYSKDVNLSWDASPSPDVTGYKICYTPNSGILVEGQDIPSEGIVPTCVDVGTELTAFVPELVDDQEYYFGVVAYNAVGKESVLSNIVRSQAFARPEPASGLAGISTVNTVPVPTQP